MEQRDMSFDDPRAVEAQIESGIRQMLGPGVAFHHTVLRPDNSNMTYGGLHETRVGGVQAKKDLVTDARTNRYGNGALGYLRGKDRDKLEKQLQKKSAKTWGNNSQVIELKVGQEYSPWGEQYYTYTHGVDDGTHGSKRKR